MRFLDPDRLNDILFAQRLDQQIINLIANALGNHSFFVGGEPLPIALIERTDRNWQWAKDWTKTTLELLKKLSLTFILTDGYLNGSAYGFDPEYTANLPNSLNLGAFPDTVSVRVPRGQRVSVTYLERAHSVPSAPYCAQVVNKISCWMLRYREFSAPNSEDLVVEIDAREILFNSMVLSKGGSLNKGANLLLYSKLANTLETIYNSLNISACKVIKQFDVIKINEYFAELPNDPVNDDVQNPTLGGYFTQPPRSLTSEIYQYGLPDNRLPYSQYANYAWKAASIVYFYGDEWYKFYDLEEFITWSLWGNPIYKPLPPENLPGDFDSNKRIVRANPVFSTLPNWFYYAGLKLADRTLLGHEFTWRYDEEAETFEAQFFDWQPEPLPESPPAGASQAQIDAYNAAVAIRRKKYTLSPNVNPELFPDFSTLQTIYRATCLHPPDMDQWVHGQLQLLGGSEPWARRGQAAVTTRDNDRTATGRLLNFVSSAYVDTRFMRGFEESNDFAIYANYPPYLIQESEAYLGIFRFEYAIDFLSGGGNKFCWFWGSQKIKITPVCSSADGTYFYQYAPEGSFDYSGVGVPPTNGGIQFGDTVNFSKSFTVKVNFRATPPTPYQPFTEAELTTISEGLDPDPDNGDIMPDSKRIVEIHEALEADLYAIDGKNRRVANLGWLINKMAHVLGLHFAPDGRMAKPPDTKHYKDGAKIPEQWQIGQFGKNKWKDSKGTWHDGVGIAYEVRSNTIDTDQFTGRSDSIEEGGWVTCNSLVQLLDTKFDDDDRAFGLQDLGANVLPSPDGQQWIGYQGMHQLLQEIAYMLAAISTNTSQTQVLAMKNNALAMENLAAHGMPVEIKQIEMEIGGELVKVPVPGIVEGSPTQVDLAVWILSNIAPILASSFSVKESK